MKKNSVKKICILGMFAAISIILTYLIRFPIFPAAAFLEYDPADLTILICTFLFGPWYGVALTIVVSALQAMTVSAQSGIIGFFMHVIATSVLCIVVGYISKIGFSKNREDLNKITKSHTIWIAISLALGTIAMAGIMVPLNLIFTPMYGVPIQVVKDMIFPVIIPFNLIKAGINSIAAFILYFPLVKATKNFLR